MDNELAELDAVQLLVEPEEEESEVALLEKEQAEAISSNSEDAIRTFFAESMTASARVARMSWLGLWWTIKNKSKCMCNLRA